MTRECYHRDLRREVVSMQTLQHKPKKSIAILCTCNAKAWVEDPPSGSKMTSTRTHSFLLLFHFESISFTLWGAAERALESNIASTDRADKEPPTTVSNMRIEALGSGFLDRMIQVIRSEAQSSPSRTEEGASSTSLSVPSRRRSKTNEVDAGISKPRQKVRESFSPGTVTKREHIQHLQTGTQLRLRSTPFNQPNTLNWEP